MTVLEPATQEITIRQGDTFRRIVRLYADTLNTVPFDATGCEIDIAVREGVAASGAPVIISASTRADSSGPGKLTWLSYVSDGTVDLVSPGNPAQGVFLWEFTPVDTKMLVPTRKPKKGSFETAKFLFDVQVTHPSGRRNTVWASTITVPLEVTE